MALPLFSLVYFFWVISLWINILWGTKWTINLWLVCAATIEWLERGALNCKTGVFIRSPSRDSTDSFMKNPIFYWNLNLECSKWQKTVRHQDLFSFKSYTRKDYSKDIDTVWSNYLRYQDFIPHPWVTLKRICILERTCWQEKKERCEDKNLILWCM